jgi:hypothetical protein
MVEAWVYPGRFVARVTPKVSEVTEAFTVRLLRDLVSLIESHPGLCHWAKRISGHLELGFQVPSHEVFETLYPLEDVHNVEQLRSAHDQQMREVRRLAQKWRSRDPVEVVQDLEWIEQEARLAGIAGPRWTHLLCRELAEETPDPSVWVRLMLDTDLGGNLARPFLKQAISATLPGWEELVVKCLDHPAFQSTAVSLILTHPTPPEHLLSQVLAVLEGHSETVRLHCLRNEVSIPALRELLHHHDEAIVEAATVGEWKAEPEESVRTAVREDWEQAVTTDVRESFWLSEILEKRSSLAQPWLQARIAEGLPPFFTRDWEQAIQAATSALNAEARTQLLSQLPDNETMAEAVIHLVGEDLAVYEGFLGKSRSRTLHLAPLFRSPDGVWVEMAKRALDTGYSSAEIAAATRQPVGVTIEWGREAQSRKWEDWIERFERLSDHEDPRIQEVGREGRRQSLALLDRARQREREEAVYGWSGPHGLSVVE